VYAKSTTASPACQVTGAHLEQNWCAAKALIYGSKIFVHLFTETADLIVHLIAEAGYLITLRATECLLASGSNAVRPGCAAAHGHHIYGTCNRD
jgi:hypothetical protein